MAYLVIYDEKQQNQRKKQRNKEKCIDKVK